MSWALCLSEDMAEKALSTLRELTIYPEMNSQSSCQTEVQAGLL